MTVLHSAVGYILLLGMAWLAGRRGRIPFRVVGVATLLQLLLTALLLLTGVRGTVFALAGDLAQLLRDTALKANESLLFMGISNPDFTARHGPIVALEIGGIIIFVASLTRILYHYRLLPWIVGLVGRFMQRLMGISGAESVGVAANVLVGMTEAPLLIRPYVSRLTESELFCLMTAGMATIAGTVMVVYATMLGPVHPEIAGHLFTASLISAPAAIAVAKLMIPESGQPQTVGKRITPLPREDILNGLDAAARGAGEGMHLFINILAMLIAFIGLVALANAAIGQIGLWLGSGPEPWSLQLVAGHLFRVPVWLMGIPWRETAAVGELMGVKTILNEFVAYASLAERMTADPTYLSPRSFLIATYALCGFANFGSVAILIAGLGGIAPDRRADLARLALRSLLGGTLATMLTGCVVGLYL